MVYSRGQVSAIFSRILVAKGGRKALALKPSTVTTYTSSFMKAYKVIGDIVFDAEELEEYLEETYPNPFTRRGVIVSVNHFMKLAGGFDDDTKSEMQALLTRICAECNSPDTVATSWARKMPLLIKYRAIPYKELLLSLAGGAEPGDRDAIREQACVLFALIGSNPPLRSDYRKIVIADRCDPLPKRTPYYRDGKIYFPPGSRIKTGSGSPTMDVGECRPLIDDFISRHNSQYLLGEWLDPNTFAHRLLDESERQLGDKLGIRFFRAKYASDHRRRMRAANNHLQVLGHSMATEDKFYTPPVEFDEALDAPPEPEGGLIDVEMGDAAMTLLSFAA